MPVTWDNPIVIVVFLILLYIGVALCGKIFGWEKRKK